MIDKRQELPNLLLRRGLVAGETAFIGDMEHDVETALASGVHAVAVLTGYDPPGKLMRAAPEITISHLGHLRRVLERQVPSAAPLRTEVRVVDDFLEIEGLRVSTRIGAEKAERAEPQEVKVDVRFSVPSGLRDLDDDLERTVDYFAVSVAIRAMAATGERRLIETLAEDVIRLLHEKYGAPWCRVRLRKFIIPETEWVAVVLESKIPGNEAGAGQRLFTQVHECPQDA